MSNPTPTPGAMRAAEKLANGLRLIGDFPGGLTQEIAVLITEETGVAELLEAAETYRGLFNQARVWVELDSLRDGMIRKAEQADALLAKHTTQPHRPGEGKV